MIKPAAYHSGLLYFKDMGRNFLILTILVFSLGARSAHFTFLPELKAAYGLIIDLRVEEAQDNIEALKKSDPQNLMVYYIENYADFIRALISEEEEHYQRLLQGSESRLKMLAGGDPSDPYFRFTQAEVLLQTSLIGLRHGAYYKAVKQASRAYGLLTENDELFPRFLANKKSLGILHAMIGSIPDQYRWFAEILGFEGSIESGRREIEEVIAFSEGMDFLFREETLVLYASVLLNFCNDENGARSIIDQLDETYCQGGLVRYISADMLLKMGDSREALRQLDQIPDGERYMSIPKVHYLRGLADLYDLREEADKEFHLFLTSYDGSDLIKDTYLKLAWHDVIFNNGVHFDHWVDLCLIEGEKVLNKDKYAYRWATKRVKPCIELLRARLLFDGGYYARSVEQLKMIEVHDLSEREKLELNYRKARNFHELNQYKKALDHYVDVLAFDLQETPYEQANAALQAGLIYEVLGQHDPAERYFRFCIELDPTDYDVSLDLKAKAGLERILKEKLQK